MTKVQKTARERIIEAIDSPLGFYVLALLIVESFLGLVLGTTKLDADHQFSGMLWGIGLFVFVVLIVTILVWFRPLNLTFDRAAHLKQARQGPFGTEKKQVKDIDELLPKEADAKEGHQ
jgi:cbb3-type cytochrome oxidase subunit 1